MQNERVNSQSVLPLFLKSEIKEMSRRNMTTDNTVASPHYCSHTLLVAIRAEASHALTFVILFKSWSIPVLTFLKSVRTYLFVHFIRGRTGECFGGSKTGLKDLREVRYNPKVLKGCRRTPPSLLEDTAIKWHICFLSSFLIKKQVGSLKH